MTRAWVMLLACAAGCIYLPEQDYPDDWKEADRAGCEYGNPEACYRVAKYGLTADEPYYARACSMGHVEGCNEAAWRAQRDVAWLTRACDLGAGVACSELAEKEADPQAAGALRERACQLRVKSCLPLGREVVKDDPALARRLGERACATSPDLCREANELIYYARKTCPKSEPNCTLPPISLEDACRGDDRESCTTLGRRLTHAGK